VLTTDVAIVGAGPVGLFAIFQCGMLGLRTHVIDSLDTIGGQCIALYPDKPIYDIPAWPVISGADLVEQLRRQAEPFTPVYHLGQEGLSLERLPDGRLRLGTTAGILLEAGAVIVAAGAGAFQPNRPPLPDIEHYEGKSVFYAISRREDLANKRVVIAGGGDSAVDWALALVGLADSVTVVHRRAKFSAAPASTQRMLHLVERGEIELVVPYQLHDLAGADGRLEALTVSDTEGRRRDLPADALLAFFGLSTDLGPLSRWGFCVDKQQVSVDPTTAETSIAGVYAIGDVASYANKPKLILTGFAEAALAARAILSKLRPGDALHIEHSTTKGVPGLGRAA
jgi:thioredoxin reductase (NADPH)